MNHMKTFLEVVDLAIKATTHYFELRKLIREMREKKKEECQPKSSNE